jgi:nucleotide-binding universal stress UspA family protein
MYKKMLVPLDGSELAEVALMYAKEVASKLHLSLVLLHVYSSVEAEHVPELQAYIDSKVDAVRRELKIGKVAGNLPAGEKLTVRGELAEGYPAEEILRYAEQNGIDFILMSTHGRTGIKLWTMGSVADKVLRASKVPVWLIRAGAPPEAISDKLPTRRMLVLLDGSELAESVLPHVETLAKQQGADLVDIILLGVCELTPVAVYYYSTVPIDWEDYIARCRLEDKQYLDNIEKRLKSAGLKAHSELLTGKPADAIIDYVSKNPVNLIVMSTHGRSGLGRWVYGSVAEKILHGTPTPVFLVRPH